VRIGLNLVYLVPGETGGMEVYARELIPALHAAAPPGTTFTAFVNREAASERHGPWHELCHTVTVPVRARRRTEWVRGEQQLLPGLARRAGVDLVHSLANTGPLLGRFVRITTIHDLHYRLVPEAHFGLLALGLRLLVPGAARRSKRIITGTESARSDLIAHLGIPAERIDVVPHGIGTPARARPTGEGPLRRRLDLGERPVVLSVSAKRPHKNLGRVIEAMALLDPAQRPVLVLPGYATPHEEELRALAAQLGIAADVRFLGWVDPEELEGLYALTAACVFPSLYEGFGLPVLEAMSRGVPVACSSRRSLAEVAGDGALLFDPEDARAIADAVGRLLREPEERERLRSAGRAQAARFSWERCARLTLASYERALASRAQGA
jgi:glycosyltransferase involved in cell wall biosynthesis